jgi:hypothetical protein
MIPDFDYPTVKGMVANSDSAHGISQNGADDLKASSVEGFR